MAHPIMRPAGESNRPMPRRFPFSRERLAGVARPGAGRIHVYDTKTPHLVYMITSNGATSWLWYGRVRGEGRPIRYRIGAGEEVTLEKARDCAVAITAGARQGVSPDATWKAAAGVKTVGQAFAWYIDEHAKPRKRTWEQDQKQHDRYLKHLDGRKLDSITAEEVRRLHAKIGATAPTAANRMLALLSVVFNKALKSDDYHFPGENPTLRVEKFKEHARDRFLQAGELRKFTEALKDEPSAMMADFFELALWTGARRSNVQSARWDEINLETQWWTIPAAKAKAGKAIEIPLSAPAIAVLRRRRAGRSPWVFPSTSRSGHLMEPKNAWAKLLERAGLMDVRIHDLRRTHGSWQAITGASLPVIGKSLGHQNQATTQIYAQLSRDPVRAAVDTATAAMQAAIKGKSTRKKTRVKIAK